MANLDVMTDLTNRHSDVVCEIQVDAYIESLDAITEWLLDCASWTQGRVPSVVASIDQLHAAGIDRGGLRFRNEDADECLGGFAERILAAGGRVVTVDYDA